MTGLPTSGDQFGRYTIVRPLGRGGMGTVFEAIQEGLNRRVALKLLAPDLMSSESYRNRFAREAETLAQLESPHVIQVYDAGEHGGWLYIATQLIPEGDLNQHLREHGPLGPQGALAVTAQVAAGLRVAHRAGILHRDIKPSNVLLRRSDEGWTAFVCDLGISQVTAAEHTRTVGVIGTLGYMAPERHEGAEASVASDIYSLGCLLWACVSGQAPYTGTDLHVALAHINDPVPQMAGSSEYELRVNAVLRTAMAKDPSDRYATAEEMRTALATAPATQTDDLTWVRPVVETGITGIGSGTAPLEPTPPTALTRPELTSGDAPSRGDALDLVTLFVALAAVGVGVAACADGEPTAFDKPHLGVFGWHVAGAVLTVAALGLLARRLRSFLAVTALLAAAFEGTIFVLSRNSVANFASDGWARGYYLLPAVSLLTSALLAASLAAGVRHRRISGYVAAPAAVLALAGAPLAMASWNYPLIAWAVAGAVVATGIVAGVPQARGTRRVAVQATAASLAGLAASVCGIAALVLFVLDEFTWFAVLNSVALVLAALPLARVFGGAVESACASAFLALGVSMPWTFLALINGGVVREEDRVLGRYVYELWEALGWEYATRSLNGVAVIGLLIAGAWAWTRSTHRAWMAAVVISLATCAVVGYWFAGYEDGAWFSAAVQPLLPLLVLGVYGAVSLVTSRRTDISVTP